MPMGQQLLIYSKDWLYMGLNEITCPKSRVDYAYMNEFWSSRQFLSGHRNVTWFQSWPKKWGRLCLCDLIFDFWWSRLEESMSILHH